MRQAAGPVCARRHRVRLAAQPGAGAANRHSIKPAIGRAAMVIRWAAARAARFRHCLGLRAKAREQIGKTESTYAAYDRTPQCNAAQVYLPSYIEMAACLEMARQET